MPTSGPLDIDGELIAADSPQWDLPNFINCTIVGDSEDLALYATYVFCNTGLTDTWDIQAYGGNDDEDAYTLGSVAVFAYEGDGFPADPLACIDEADNHPAGENALLPAVEVEAGERITVIVSSFSYVIDGTFRLTVSPN